MGTYGTCPLSIVVYKVFVHVVVLVLFCGGSFVSSSSRVDEDGVTEKGYSWWMVVPPI